MKETDPASLKVVMTERFSIQIDPVSDAIYIELSPGENVSMTTTIRQSAPLINFDYNKNGDLVGIEIV